MKKLSKIVALLLAGVMAMVMLTACSGGGTAADTEKEEAIRKQLGRKTQATALCDNDGKVKNDSKLYKETAELLDARIKAETSAFGILAVDFDVKGIDPAEQFVTVTLSADYKTAGLVAGFVTKRRKKARREGGTIENGFRCALAIFSGIIILNFAFVALCGALQTHFHEEGFTQKAPGSGCSSGRGAVTVQWYWSAQSRWQHRSCRRWSMRRHPAR